MRYVPHLKRNGLAALGITLALGACLLAGRLPDDAPPPQAASTFMITSPPGTTVTYRGGGLSLLSDGLMILPLDGYDAYAEFSNEELVYRAATSVEQSCMRTQGFALPAGYGGLFLPSGNPPLAQYGVASMAEAKEYGYRLPGSTVSSPSPAVPQKVLEAFYGTKNSAGCAGRAYTTLDIAASNDAYAYVQQLRSQALADVYSDKRVIAANTAWSACMASSGYHYANPLDPARDRGLLGRGLPVPRGASIPPPSPAEKAVAVADVTCKQRVGYLATFGRVTALYQERLISANSAKLQQALREWQVVLNNADVAVGS
jgi:hypothetical protein